MNLYVNTVDNMLLSEDKNTVKITDFGLAREEIIGDMSTEAGTYRWMAPEVFICHNLLYVELRS